MIIETFMDYILILQLAWCTTQIYLNVDLQKTTNKVRMHKL